MILLKKTNNTQTFYVTKSYGVEAAQIPVGSYTKQEADALFQPKGNYPTEEEIQEMIDTTLDENVYPKIEEESQERRNGDALTLLAAKGYTDSKLLEYYDKTEVDELLETKQDVLVSGVNIKTLNGESLLGEGNIDITVNVENFYTKDEVDEKVSNLESEISTKQDELISGTTIKTINGESLLGEGNITTPNPDDFYTKTESDSKYQPIGDYVDNTTFEASQKAQDDKVDNLSTNLTNSIEQAKNDAIGQSKNYTDEKISEIPVDTFATKDELEDKADKTEVSSLTDRVEELEESKADLIYVDDELDKKADKTDLDEYATKEYVDEAVSEVDAYTKSEADAKFGTLEEQKSLRNDVEQALGEIAELEADKLDKTGLKTINGESLLGEGDIEIKGGGKEPIYIPKDASTEDYKEFYKDILARNFSDVYVEVYKSSEQSEWNLVYKIIFSDWDKSVKLHFSLNQYTIGDTGDNLSLQFRNSYTALYEDGLINTYTSPITITYLGKDYVDGSGSYSSPLKIKQTSIEDATELKQGLADAYDVKQYVDSHSSGDGKEDIFIKYGDWSGNYKEEYDKIISGDFRNVYVYTELENLSKTYNNVYKIYWNKLDNSIYLYFDNSPSRTLSGDVLSANIDSRTVVLYSNGSINSGSRNEAVLALNKSYFNGDGTEVIPLSIKQANLDTVSAIGEGLADAYDVKQYVDSHSGGSGSNIYVFDDSAEDANIKTQIQGFYDIVDAGKLDEYVFLIKWIGDRQTTRQDLYVVNRIIKNSDNSYYLSINDPRKTNSYLGNSFYGPSWMNVSISRGGSYIGYTTSDNFALYKNENTISGNGTSINPWTVKVTSLDTVTDPKDGFATAFETKQYIDSHSGGGSVDIEPIIFTSNNPEQNLKSYERLMALDNPDECNNVWIPSVRTADSYILATKLSIGSSSSVMKGMFMESQVIYYITYTLTHSTGSGQAGMNYTYSLPSNYYDRVVNTPTDTNAELAKKQDILVSGTNIKTINGESILGSGDITIEGGGSSSILLHSGDTVADLYTQLKAGEHPTIYVDDYNGPVLMTYYDVKGYADTVILYGYKSENSVTYSDSTDILKCNITSAGKVSTSNLKVNILTDAERTKISNIPTKYVTDITQNGGHITVNNASGSETVIDFCTINGQSIFGQNDLKVASNEKVAELEAKIAQLEATIGTLNQRLTTLIGE